MYKVFQHGLLLSDFSAMIVHEILTSVIYARRSAQIVTLNERRTLQIATLHDW